VKGDKESEYSSILEVKSGDVEPPLAPTGLRAIGLPTITSVNLVW